MRILYVHNFYRMAGGEDETFADEMRLMRAHGHAVDGFEARSETILARNRIAAGIAGVWSRAAQTALGAKIAAFRPEVVHFHNTYPVLSPAVFRTAADAGAAVVHTLHNYRILCSHAGLTRGGRPCEDCVGAPAPWRGIVHGCNHNGRMADAQIAATSLVHRLAGTYSGRIDRFIALNGFARAIYERGGLPAAKFAVLPTFVDPDPGIGPGDGGYALFVGRFTAEKGVLVMIEAWRRAGPALPLHIAGSGGPLAEAVAAAAREVPGIVYHGRVERERLVDLMRRASVLVFPSTWYEGTPRTIAEALAAGTPVVASELGAMKAMVTPGENGFWFRAGDPDALAATIRRIADDPGAARALRDGARRSFEANYTAARHYAGLLAVYEAAIGERARSRASATPAPAAAGGARP